MAETDADELLLPIWFADTDDEEEGGDDAPGLGRRRSSPPPAASDGGCHGGWASEAHMRAFFQPALERLQRVCHHTHARRGLASDAAYAAMVQRFRSGHPCNANAAALAVEAAADLSPAAFVAQYASGHSARPVLIRGIPARDCWPAWEKCSNIEATLTNYGHIPLKVWEEPNPFQLGRPMDVRLPLAIYHEYAASNTADAPFYAFEYDFGVDTGRDVLRRDYTVPAYFSQDVFNLDRYTRAFYPNNAHVILGGPRTGTNLHFDPKGTTAWNTLLIGCKKWAFFPPGTSEEYVKLIGYHAVLNLEFSLAITENVLLPSTLPVAWPQVCKDWPRFAAYVELVAPDLLAACALAPGPAEQQPVSPEAEDKDSDPDPVPQRQAAQAPAAPSCGPAIHRPAPASAGTLLPAPDGNRRQDPPAAPPARQLDKPPGPDVLGTSLGWVMSEEDEYECSLAKYQ